MRGRGLFPAVIGAAAFAAVAFSGLTAEARGGGRPAAAWRIAPEPAWIVAAPAAGPAPAPVDESVFECLLDDTQVRVSGATVEHYHHVRYRPRSPRQVEDGSQVELEVNPAYERLVIHHVRVERAGHPVGTYGARDVKVVQREKDLDERIYDGSLSALVFLRDVRVGDIIDYAYTLEERQPLLGGKYAARFRLGDESFNATWRMRILLPAERSLNVKPRGIDVPPTVTTANGWREYRWQRQNVAPIEPEDGLPAWFDPEPWIDVSELGSWAEVASLFQRTYQVDARPSPALTEQIARLRAAGGTDEDRLLAATRFVQDDIRYLGVELGLGGARPFQPSTVLARRFGDCKDKAGLLVTLLRALGFDARTALVSTRERRALDDALPSPLVFDHAIVQVALAGQRHYIDATASYQRGPLAARSPPDFERALIVAPDTKGLTTLPQPQVAQPVQDVHEVLTVDANSPAADLEVETTLRYGEADRIRSQLADRGRKEIGREYLNYYSRDDTTVTESRPLQVDDDERRNVVTLRERYHFANLWHDGRRDLVATAIDDHLAAPRIRLRRMPYGLELPLVVRHQTVIRLPDAPDDVPQPRDIGDEHLRFRSEAHAAGHELSLVYELQTLQDAVAPDKAERFFHMLDEIRRRDGYVLARPNGEAGGSLAWLKTAAGFVGVAFFAALPVTVLALSVRGAWQRAKRRRYKAGRRFASGEAAATAIAVAAADEIDGRVEAIKCPCGARYRAGSPEEDQHASYDGRTLVVRSAECPGCSRRASFFFSVEAEGA